MSDHDHLQWLATQKGVTRRVFMGQAAALGASTALATSLAGKAVFAQETPQKGGHLKLGIDGAESTDSLDPATYTATYLQTVAFQWGNCLVEIDENAKIIPELAESWEPSADAKQWVFKIRKGVQFHNGKELTAEDVKYSLDTIMTPPGDGQNPGASFFANIAAVEATDPLTVTITTSKVDPTIPGLFAWSRYTSVFPAGMVDEINPGRRSPALLQQERDALATAITFLLSRP